MRRPSYPNIRPYCNGTCGAAGRRRSHWVGASWHPGGPRCMVVVCVCVWLLLVCPRVRLDSRDCPVRPTRYLSSITSTGTVGGRKRGVARVRHAMAISSYHDPYPPHLSSSQHRNRGKRRGEPPQHLISVVELTTPPVTYLWAYSSMCSGQAGQPEDAVRPTGACRRARLAWSKDLAAIDPCRPSSFSSSFEYRCELVLASPCHQRLQPMPFRMWLAMSNVQ